MTPAESGHDAPGSDGRSSSLHGSFASPKIGATLGRYEIVATLGHGAMATVFRARDTQLGRDVAIKVMSMVHAARGGASERFRREAHAVAALKHPGIVEIFDFVAETEDDPSYIVAELISGPTLRKLVEERGGRLLPEIAALIALPLAEALAFAHERGVIHRDIKPDNVMIESSGDGSRVVLTDFGVAHITGMETMTATGALVGSPAYMSPEQSQGHDVDPTTDIWSLGVMLFELVTGVVPFAGKDPFTMIAAILRGTFRRPSQIVATVGADFEAMLLRCLRASSAERYPNARQLAAELRAFTVAAGLDPEDKALRRYLDDADGTLAELRPRIAEMAVERARQCARHGQLARALAEIGHATAYVPNHAGAERLLRRLSASRLVIKAAVVLMGLAVATSIVFFARPFLTRKPTAAISAARLAAVPLPEARPAAVPQTPVTPATSVPQAASPTVSAQAGASPRSKSAKRNRAPRFSTTEPIAEAASVSAASVQPAPKLDPSPILPQVVEAPRLGTISLFAKGGFCFPSLDDHPVGDLMPVFRDIQPGKHKIYCSRTKQSSRELVGEVDLPPGAKIERTVTEADGRLIIARPR